MGETPIWKAVGKKIRALTDTTLRLFLLYLVLLILFKSLVILINLIGSFGDIYMGIRILGYCTRDGVINRDYGFDVIKI